jgi:hypothetical protein
MTTEIRKKFLGSILDSGDANYRLAIKNGAIDGLANSPPSDATALSLWEGRFLDSSKSAWNSYQSLMKIERERGLAEFSAMSEKLERDTNRSEESLGSRQKKALDLLESEMGESSMTYRRLRADFDEKRDAALEIERRLGRPLQVSLVKGYMPLMIILSLSEVAVNRLAFELFFESMPAVSLLLAAAVGALLMFFAHIVGKQYRHAQCPLTVTNKTGMFYGIFGMLFVCLLLMYFLGLMREELVRIQAPQINLEDMSLDDLTKGAVSSGFSLALGTSGAFLLLLNFVIFLTGLTGSYFRHDSHPYFENVSAAFAKSKKVFEQHQRAFENRQVEILREYNSEATKNEAELAHREEQINEIARKRAAVDREVGAAQAALAAEMSRCLRAYRGENLSNRTTPPPAYFAESVEALSQEIVKL